MPGMFVDAHAHIYPAQIAPKIIADITTRGDIECYSLGTGMALLRSMEVSGVDISIISRITTRPDQTEAINDWLQQKAVGRLKALANIGPDMAQGPDAVGLLKARGFKGIKIHPDYQGFYADDPRMYPYYEAAQAAQMPILFHAGLDRGLPPPVHAMPWHLHKVLTDFPDLKIVAAHMGGEDNYRETEELLLGTPIYLDTSYVLRLMTVDTLKRFVRRHPVDRIIFGSDNPWKDQRQELQYLLDLPFLSDDAKEKIAGGNAVRLFGI